MQILHCRKTPEWSGMTGLWWSQAGCLNHLLAFHVLLRLPTGFVPWTFWALRWGWLVSSFQGPPLSLLKSGHNIPFFQSMETWLDYHNFSNIMNSGLATILANSLRTLDCISLGPIDLCLSRFLRWFQTWSFSTVALSNLLFPCLYGFVPSQMQNPALAHVKLHAFGGCSSH